MTQNRILLTRAIEEAEGYRELGMLEHALRALQRRGSLVHGNGRACFLLGEAFHDGPIFLPCWMGRRLSGRAKNDSARPGNHWTTRRRARSFGGFVENKIAYGIACD